MTSLVREELSDVEREVVDAIRIIRHSENPELLAVLSKDPSRLMHHFIAASHGHVKLRVTTVANELAVEMRTLQRDFTERFNRSMRECQVDARLSYSKRMLRAAPTTKISAIAATLGYRAVSDFNRFFQKHVHKTPFQWRHDERLKSDGLQ